jgi:ADP-ribose pyrophosphatase YjhB (NUDIX family)
MDKFCSQCGAALTSKFDGGRLRPACSACGHIVYGHYSLGVGGLLLHEGRVLLIQRAQQPNIHLWTLPGGFVETDETPDEAVLREVLEETGLRTRVLGLLGSRHWADSEEHSIYYVFGLVLDGPLAELRPDGVETERAEFISPEAFTDLDVMGPISRWFCEHFHPEDVALESLPKEKQPTLRRSDRKMTIYIPRGRSEGIR